MDLQKLYGDPKFPASFSGRERFFKAAKQLYPRVSRKDVQKELAKNDSYTLHKPTKSPKLYRRIFTKGIGYLYQIDLVDMQAYSSENDDFRWLITVIDTFSKKAWGFKIKRKTGSQVTAALKSLIETNDIWKLEIDRGSEFYNDKFLKLLRDNNIQWYSSYGTLKTKNSIIERFNRTLKTRMFRAFTKQGSHRWVDIIQDLIDGYNNSKHRSIGMTPNQVTKRNEHIVRKTLYPKIKKKSIHKTAYFSIGDTVRITRKKVTFQKGYEQTYSYEVFEIFAINLNTYPVTYRIRDYKGQDIKGSFYKEELQLVDKSDNIYPIEKILNTRRVRGGIQYLVKYLGYPETYWVAQQDLFKL